MHGYPNSPGGLPRAGKEGAFEKADGGTLFIDEVAELAPAVQSRLLIPLDGGIGETRFDISRLGIGDPITVDVRVISGTNKDLREEVKAGRFLAALRGRLAHQNEIRVPSLRERSEDIPLLVHFFLDTFASKEGQPPRQVSHFAIEDLMERDYLPDNIRQLRGKLRAAYNKNRRGPVLMLSDFGFEEPKLDEAPDAKRQVNVIPLEPVPAQVSRAVVMVRPGAEGPAVTAEGNGPGQPAQPARISIKDSNRDLMLHALEATEHNITAAAERLGVHRNTLLNWMDKFGIPRDRQRPRSAPAAEEE